MCQHLQSSLKIFLCLSETSKKIGAWDPNRCWDIDFPSPTCILLNLAKIQDTDALPCGVQTPLQWSKMFLCVSETSKKFGAWGPNRCWDIDFPTPPCICSTWPSFRKHDAPSMGVTTPPQCLKMFLCVSETSKQNLVYGALIDAEILTPSLLPCICLTWPSYGHWYSMPCGMYKHLPSSLKMFLCVSGIL